MSDPDYVATPAGKVHFYRPQPEDFDPWHTANSLSRINRYAGNWGALSVAQHALTVVAMVRHLDGSYKQQLSALHHDDSEMIIGDIPNPIKQSCPELVALENRIHNALNIKYGIYIQDDLIKKADFMVFQNEVRCLVPPTSQHLFERYNVDECEVLLTRRSFTLISAQEAAAAWYDMHQELTDCMHMEMLTSESVGEA